MSTIRCIKSEAEDIVSAWLGSLGWRVVHGVGGAAGMSRAARADRGLRVKGAGRFMGTVA